MRRASRWLLGLCLAACGGEIEQASLAIVPSPEDFNAEIQRDHPSKFTCGFVVHPGFLAGALWEIERCVEELGLRVLCLPTHFMDWTGQWKCIFDDEIADLFQRCSDYNLAVEIHPYDGEKLVRLENTAWRFHLIWMLAQCADAYHFMTLKGYQEKFPNMRVCFAHGAQLAQINLGRRIQGFDGRPDLFEGMQHPRKAVGHPNIFFDTLVHDTGSLKLLIENQSTRQVILGLDDPYPLGEMESAPQSSYPGKILDLAIERDIINREQYEAIWCDNVIQWIHGDDESARQELVRRIQGQPAKTESAQNSGGDT